MRNTVRRALILLLLTAGAACYGQAAPAKPAFEVATIKPSAPLDVVKLAAQMQAGQMPQFGAVVTASQAQYTYMTLKELIANAYGVKAFQISGPDWLGSQRFNIVAKMPENATKSDAPAMLQTLLEDRFKLAIHKESQEHPVLGLVVAKGGPKLKEATTTPVPIDENAPLKPGEMKMNMPDGPARVTPHPDGSATVNMGERGTFTQRIDAQAQAIRIEASSLTMPGFADMLTRTMQMGGGGGRQVVDMTGLKGSYEVAMNISLADMLASAKAQGIDIPAPRPAGIPGNSTSSGAPVSSAASSAAIPEASEPSGVSTTYQSVEALGLKLEPRKAVIEQLIVDHVEKTPTEN
jgi:uncharacterized protein (TIGR03435 family)